MSELGLELDDSSQGPGPSVSGAGDVGETDRGPDDIHEPTPAPNADNNGAGQQSNPKYKIGEPSEGFDIRSSVAYSHNYFTPTEIEGVPYALCRLCDEEENSTKNRTGVKPNKRVKKSKLLKTVGGSTRGLFTHMESHHESSYRQMMIQYEHVEQLRREKADRKRKRSGDGKTQLKLFVSGNNNQVSVDKRLDPELQSRWDTAVVDFVAEAGVSFEVCTKLDILLRSIWPNGRLRVKVRNGNTVSSHVSKMSIDLKRDVYSIIKSDRDQTKSFAFTTDLWRSRSLDSFMALTCHYINGEFELVKLVPFIEYFGSNRHTGENLQVMMDQFMSALGLEGEEFGKYVVCDNASNNVVMIRLANDIEEYYCAIHTLALAVKAIFLIEILTIKVQTCIWKCNEVAKYVRRSEHNRNDLREACKTMEIGFIMPKKPVDTRWNSVEANVTSILRLMPALQYLSTHDETLEWSDIVPNAAEAKVLESLVDILTQLKIATKKWEGEKEPTLQAVIPELWNVKDTLEKKITARERYVSTFAKQLKKLVLERFPSWGTGNRLTSMAHFLDPEYQGLVLKQFPGAYNRTLGEIKKVAAKYCDQNESHHQEQIVRTNSDENENLTAAQRLKLSRPAVIEHDDNIDGNRTKIEIELDKYQNMKINHCSNILMFWKDNQDILPLLTLVAKEVLAIPASSASSERVFSVGSLMCTAKRSRLKPEKVSDLMMLKLNSQTVSYLKSRKSYEKVYTSEQIKNLISVDFEPNLNPDADEAVEYVEDLEDEEEDSLDEVTVVDVEDNT